MLVYLFLCIYTYTYICIYIYTYIHTYFNRFWLDWIAWILTFCGIGLLLETLGHRTRYKQVSNLFVLVLWLWLKHKGILGYGKRKTKVGMQILLYRFLHFMHVLYVFLRTLDGWNCKIGCSSTTHPGYVHMDVEYIVHSILNHINYIYIIYIYIDTNRCRTCFEKRVTPDGRQSPAMCQQLHRLWPVTVLTPVSVGYG